MHRVHEGHGSVPGYHIGLVVSLIYLVAYVAVMLVRFADPTTSVHRFPYEYVWGVGGILYPLCLRVMRTGWQFWRGLLMILLISVIAQAVEIVVYLIRTRSYRYGDTDTIVLGGFYLIEPLASAILWYPIGYLVSWLLFQWRRE